jgi:tetratricopeptide (TPR) repeat protein
MPTKWREIPFIGRQAEQEALLKALEEARRGQGTLFILRGQAGVGKTRLCDELLSRARKEKFHIQVGRCHPNSATPYSGFRQLVGSSIAEQSSRGEGIGDVGHLAEARGASDRSMFDILRYLKGRGVPALVLVEDLHWADEATLNLFEFIGRNVKDGAIVLVGTFRPDDMRPSIKERVDDFARQVAPQGRLRDLTLERMGEEDSLALLQHLSDQPISPALAQAIFDASAGNPMQTIQTFKLMAATGAILQKNGGWVCARKPDPEAMSIPFLIRGFMARLGTDERRGLQLCSIFGETFPAVFMERAGFPASRLERSLDLGILEGREEQLRFAHEKVMSAIYATIPVEERAALHARAAASIRECDQADNRCEEMSWHCMIAGDMSECAQFSLEAGRRCIANYQLDGAVPFMERVCESAPQGSVERKEALAALAIIHTEFSQYESALPYYQEYFNLPSSSAERGMMLSHYAEIWAPTRLGKGSADFTLNILDEAEACTGISDFDLGEVYNTRAVMCLVTGRTDEVEALFCRSEELFAKAGAKARLVEQLSYHISLCLTEGRISDALDYGSRGADVLRTVESPRGSTELNHYLAIALVHAGRIEEAAACIETSVHLARILGHRTNEFWNHYWLALGYETLGELEAAWQEINRAKMVAQMTESTYNIMAAECLLAHIEMALRRGEEADLVLARIDSLAQTFQWKMRTNLRGLIGLIHAERVAMKGRWEEAGPAFTQAQELLQGSSFGFIYQALGHLWCADCAAAAGDAERRRLELQEARALFLRLSNHMMVARIDGDLMGMTSAS